MSQPTRILVVEDNPGDVRLVEEALRGAGPNAFELTRAGRISEAAHHLETDVFDAVLLDLSLPDGQGLDTVRAIYDCAPTAPIVILTGNNDESMALKAVHDGVQDYLTKGQVSEKLIVRSIRYAIERKRAEEALRESEERFRVLYDDNPTMYFTLNLDGRLLSANRYGAQLLGYGADELIGQPVSRIYTSGEQARRDLLSRLQGRKGVHRREISLLRKDGSVIWVREISRLIDDADGTGSILTVCEDITETRELSRKLAHQASHDSLTGLMNRRAFEQRLRQTFKSACADGTEHALCYLDLDQFKVVNDTCGHIAGDKLLQELTAIFRSHVRKQDTLARLGGDEFGLLLERCSLVQAQRVANALRETVEGFRFVWDQKSFKLGVSVGLVPITEQSGSLTNILSAADAACYSAKDEGRNRVHVYTDGDVHLVRLQGEMQWVSRLHQALDEGRFHLYCQPIVEVNSTDAGAAPRPHHFELLLRMKDEQGRMVLPGAFLPAADRYHLSPSLDRWVIRTALDWLSTHGHGLENSPFFCVNLSGHSLGDDDFLRYVVAEFERSGVSPRDICFEITETAAVAKLAWATKFIETLRDLGCRFSLDDFGTGLSSFAYLKTLPVDYLKIDGLFVKDIGHDPIDREMVESINRIGHVMGKQTVAEFVEDREVLEILRDIGVDFAQGYGIARPHSLDDLLDVRNVV